MALVTTAADRAADAARALATRALREPLALTSIPPLGAPPFAYGDVVPLGLLLMALEAAHAPEAQDLREHLLTRRVNGLWPYQTGGLETSIDSALVLLGVMDPASIEALERFNIGGGYVPQLFTDGREPGKMTVRDSLLHWCQPDYSIACLVHALRRKAGLAPVMAPASLDEGFANRSGLYLANPYFVDWFLAMSAEGDLRDRLRRELLAGASPDGTFGRYDVMLSTALAVLALRALGVDVTRHVDALAARFERDGILPATPFYSTEQIDWSKLAPWDLLAILTTEGGEQLIRVKGKEHAITWYRDAEGLVVAPLVALALRDGELRGDRPEVHEQPHPRYACATASEYIAEFALVPYV
ncbi:MAG: hypothetical protein QOE68_1674 [Thermoanaerobaculia bacterium]|jgi:hypothetical protein|nr:hypothetical protein [Thermoanaerobaculia bacterium]